MPQMRKSSNIANQKNLNIIVTVLFLIAIITMTISANLINAENIEDEKARKLAAEAPTPQTVYNSKSLPEEYESKNFSAEQVFKGDLILVNNKTECKINGDNLVSLYENYNNTYTVSNTEVTINESIVDSVNRMFTDFYDKNGSTDIVVACAYRSKDTQQQLYQKDLENNEKNSSDWVAKPGFSEHQTGLAFDLTLIDEYGTTNKYDGTGVYSWINQNCYKYGFIIRYEEDKTAITGIGYEPWHFRYVGNAHAYYINQNNLSLEEYTDILQKHIFSDPLLFTDEKDNSYMVYYVPSSGLSTPVKVPLDFKYSISGNNKGGFFVTVEL